MTNDEQTEILSYSRDRLLIEQERVDEALSDMPGSEQGTAEYERLTERQTALESALEIQDATAEPKPLAVLTHTDGTSEELTFTDSRACIF